MSDSIELRDKTSRIMRHLVFGSSCQKPVQDQINSF